MKKRYMKKRLKMKLKIIDRIFKTKLKLQDIKYGQFQQEELTYDKEYGKTLQQIDEYSYNLIMNNKCYQS